MLTFSMFARIQYTLMLPQQQARWGIISRQATNFRRDHSPSNFSRCRCADRGDARVPVRPGAQSGKNARFLFDVRTPRFGSRKIVRLNRIKRLSGPHIEFRSPSATIREGSRGAETVGAQRIRPDLRSPGSFRPTHSALPTDG